VTSVPVTIGTREIVVRHPAHGERKQTIEVRSGEPAVLTVNLDTPPATGADANGLPPVMPTSPPPGGNP
jgi:hypothetical protein